MPTSRFHSAMNALAVLLPSLVAVPAMGQIGNPGGLDPATTESAPGTPAAGQANAADKLFVKLVGMGNAGEVDLGKLADANGSHAGVKAFARRMAQDHSATATKLSAAAKPAGIPVPTAPGPDQKATRASLEGLQGAAFDAVYLQAQLIEHQKTVQLLEWEIGSGQEASLQRLAMETLPVVLDHLAMVQALIAETRGTAPQGLAGAQVAERTTRP